MRKLKTLQPIQHAVLDYIEDTLTKILSLPSAPLSSFPAVYVFYPAGSFALRPVPTKRCKKPHCFLAMETQHETVSTLNIGFLIGSHPQVSLLYGKGQPFLYFALNVCDNCFLFINYTLSFSLKVTANLRCTGWGGVILTHWSQQFTVHTIKIHVWFSARWDNFCPIPLTAKSVC